MGSDMGPRIHVFTICSQSMILSAVFSYRALRPDHLNTFGARPGARTGTFAAELKRNCGSFECLCMEIVVNVVNFTNFKSFGGLTGAMIYSKNIIFEVGVDVVVPKRFNIKLL